MADGVQPITYKGYNDKDEHIVTVPAIKANPDLIDVKGVSDAIKTIKTTIGDSLTAACSGMEGVFPDVKESLVVKGFGLTDTLVQLEETLKQLPEQINGELDTYTEAAQKAADTLQEACNEAAESECRNASGVVRVSQG